ncbi:hypothetical protein [Streptosporangium sp. H16]|uniref:hypothetical protein n=1 Tax=Streptosporangium sp. H16 TaxID=3444184 RepID=UPI003F7AF418
MSTTSAPVGIGPDSSRRGEFVDFTNADTRGLGVIVEVIADGDYAMANLISHSYERDRDEETFANVLDLRPPTDVEPEEMVHLLAIRARILSPNPEKPAAFIHDGHLICPACASKDRVLEFAEAFKAHTLTVDGDTLSASNEATTFETDRFECDACGAEVEIPDSINIIHS